MMFDPGRTTHFLKVNGSLLSFKDVFRNDRHLGSNRDDVGPKIGFLRGRVTLKGYQKVK